MNNLLQALKENPCPRELILLLGLPGSGKTTLAKSLQASLPGSVKIHSADDYFLRPDGSYVFEQHKGGWVHDQNLRATEESLRLSFPVVVVDNTNLRSRARKPYLQLAAKYQYVVHLVKVGEFTAAACKVYAGRNVHGLDEKALQSMLARAQLPD